MAVLLRVPEVDDPDFLAEMSYAEGAVLRMTGSADRTAVKALVDMFETLHAELCRRAVRLVVVDLHDVDYFAAPCFRELIAWVGKLHTLPPQQRYKVRFRGNRAMPWHTHGLAALVCFDTALLSVEMAGRS